MVADHDFLPRARRGHNLSIDDELAEAHAQLAWLRASLKAGLRTANSALARLDRVMRRVRAQRDRDDRRER